MLTACLLFAERIIADHAPYNHHFEVAWAIWLARSLNIRLPFSSSSLVFRMENDVCALLALHLRSRRLISGSALGWLSAILPEDLRSSHWLLIYEAALRKGWRIPGAAAAVAADDFFEVLKNEGVSFYNSRAYNRPLNIPTVMWRLSLALGERKRALLPGAIMAVKKAEPEDYEELGGDYGNDDFHHFHPEPDEIEEIPE